MSYNLLSISYRINIKGIEVENYIYEDTLISIGQQTIKTKKETYSIQNINSIKIEQENSFFGELFKMFFTMIFVLAFWGFIIMYFFEPSKDTINILVGLGFLSFFGILIETGKENYKDKYIVYIDTSSGVKNIYSSSYKSSSEKVLNTIVGIQNNR